MLSSDFWRLCSVPSRPIHFWMSGSEKGKLNNLMIRSQTLSSLKLLHLTQHERKSLTLVIEWTRKENYYHTVDFTLFSCATRLGSWSPISHSTFKIIKKRLSILHRSLGSTSLTSLNTSFCQKSFERAPRPGGSVGTWQVLQLTPHAWPVHLRLGENKGVEVVGGRGGDG